MSAHGRAASDPGGDCTFCGHAQALHIDSPDGPTGCTAPECGNKAENRGRCAVYTSPAHQARNDRWFARYETPVTVLPAEVASRIHRAQYGEGEREHLLVFSCSCAHQAMALLGLDEDEA